MLSISKILRQAADTVDQISENKNKIMSDVCQSVGSVVGTVTRVASSSIEGLKQGFNEGLKGEQHESQVKENDV